MKNSMSLALLFLEVLEDDESGWKAKLQTSAAVTFGATALLRVLSRRIR